MQDWDTSCRDWRDRMIAKQPLVPDLPLFKDEAELALRIFRRLKLPDVNGTPTMAEAAGEWFCAIVAALFGSYDVKTNRRMIQELFLLVPKKNGKSSYSAAIMVVAMIVNRRPEAEYLLVAPTKQIADIAFKQAKGIIAADDELRSLFKKPQEHIKTITHALTGASLKIKAADTDAITGSKSTGVLVDETHEFALKPKAAEIFVEIRGALAARPDGFMVQITTQSKAPPVGVFKSELALARDVRDGLVKLPLLPVLYELPPDLSADGGWKNPKVWPMVNPNLGKSVDVRFLQGALIKAERGGPEDMALLASQHFNVEVGLSLRSDRWPGADYWQDAADTSLTLDEILLRSDVVTVGIDGGGLDDLFGLAVLGRCKITRDWLMWNRAWAHDDVLTRRRDIVSTLNDFVDDGDLIICDDPVQPIRDAADIVVRIRDSDLLPAANGVGLDPFGITSLVDELAVRGIEGDVLTAIRQGSALSPATWGLEIKLKNRTLRHRGSPLMAWCVGNAKTEVRGGAVLITKQSSGRAKIDPLIAGFNAAMLMSQNPEAAKRRSVYEDRGIRKV